jgi:drug/metabolite transporter (DMT)-like permease
LSATPVGFERVLIGRRLRGRSLTDPVSGVCGQLRGPGRSRILHRMPAGRGFEAFQLNALIRTGSLAAAAVALVFGRAFAFPAGGYLHAGLGIGLLSGVGSMLYCFARDYTPVSLVVTFSNLYIVITVVLGIVVLNEPVTVLKIAGLLCILAGVLVLAHPPARHAAGLGVGVMIGAASVFYFLGLRGLPVSVASAASNASVVVTVVLSAVFLHQRLSRAQGAAIGLTLLRATLLALSTA